MLKSKAEMMRDTLLQAIEQVRTGALTPEKGMAMAALASQVNSSLQVELKVLIAAKQSGIANLLPPTESAAATLVDEVPASSTKQIASGVVHREGGITRHRIGGDAPF